MATVFHEQISRVAEFLKNNPPEGSGMNFYSVQTPKGELILDRMYPPLGHPRNIDFFFLACLHQYGFWYGDDRGYLEPVVGDIAGKQLKGSDLLWQLFRRQLDSRPEFFDPMALAEVTPTALAACLGDDVGTQWPDFDVRLQLTRSYGRWLTGEHLAPLSIVAQANVSDHPLACFLSLMRSYPGMNPWADDCLQKKQLLLAMALSNRPERFLKVADDDRWSPIVDYHLMRVALRLGLVNLSSAQRQANEGRAWVSESEEREIRLTVQQAVSGLIDSSGLSMAQVDEMLWMARKYCPETTEPECAKCSFASVCARRTELFQPVLRTTAY